MTQEEGINKGRRMLHYGNVICTLNKHYYGAQRKEHETGGDM